MNKVLPVSLCLLETFLFRCLNKVFVSLLSSETFVSGAVRADLRDVDVGVRPSFSVETKRAEEESFTFLTERHLHHHQRRKRKRRKHTHTRSIQLTNQSVVKAGPD